MNAFIEKLLEDDFIWNAIVGNLPSRGNRSNTDYLKFNCPMCPSMGEGLDRKQRGGVRRSDHIGLYCFNCGFRARYERGQPLSRKMRAFFKEIGVGEREISLLVHRAARLARVLSDSNTEIVHHEDRFIPTFPTIELPMDTFPVTEWATLGCDDPAFMEVATYAESRYDSLIDRVMWCPDNEWRHRMILPFYFRDNIVGWTGRLVTKDSSDPRYMSEVPTDFLYNSDVMLDRNRKILMMPEGVLDADAIDGISPLGAKLSPRQASWITDSGKTVIVIPDRDTSGQRLIDTALRYGWKVAFPRLSRGGQNWWEEDCKDCAEAVKRYGRLYTIRSIIETATNNTLEINVRRKWLI